ncbi:hypothetical protein U1Q18_025926, partial [Sarracenia purpurea var. burkii]
FSWDDVKVDKHRENYLGHSIKAPIGRWQKGKDLHWYTRDKKGLAQDMEAAKEEIRKIKEEEEQAMREALGLAPKRAGRSQGTRLDKHEFSELVKRGSTAEDLGAGHAEAAQVQGLGFSRAPRAWEDTSSLQPNLKEELPEKMEASTSSPAVRNIEELEDERSRKKRRHEEKKHDKHEKREKRHSHDRDSDGKRRNKKDKEKKRRHDSD